MSYDSFVTALHNLYMGVSDDDIRFVAENYLMVATSVNALAPLSQARTVDYRKFLADLKLHAAEPPKSLGMLTMEQQKLYKDLSNYL